MVFGGCERMSSSYKHNIRWIAISNELIVDAQCTLAWLDRKLNQFREACPEFAEGCEFDVATAGFWDIEISRYP